MALVFYTQRDIANMDADKITEEFVNYFDGLSDNGKKRIIDARPDLAFALGVGNASEPVEAVVDVLWSSIFVTLQPNFCYGIIRHHNVPRKAFCNYCKNADVHDYNVHMQILPLQYTVLFLSDNNVDRLTHFLMY